MKGLIGQSEKGIAENSAVAEPVMTSADLMPKPRETRATIGSKRAVSCFTIGRDEEVLGYQSTCGNGHAGAVMTTL